jgi:hypothetical protein
MDTNDPTYTDEPLGELETVPDFLPPPEALIPKAPETDPRPTTPPEAPDA